MLDTNDKRLTMIMSEVNEMSLNKQSLVMTLLNIRKWYYMPEDKVIEWFDKFFIMKQV